MSATSVDRAALEPKVKSTYSDVAQNPHGEFHFEMGRAMAERLGYAPKWGVKSISLLARKP